MGSRFKTAREREREKERGTMACDRGVGGSMKTMRRRLSLFAKSVLKANVPEEIRDEAMAQERARFGAMLEEIDELRLFHKTRICHAARL